MFFAGSEHGIGIDLNEKEYIKVSKRIWNLERLFDIRNAGILT